MGRTWIQSYPTCSKWDLLALKPEHINASDVAWHLSQVNRYTGGSRVPYSVAEHCVRVSLAVEQCMRQANAASAGDHALAGGRKLYSEEEIRLAALAGLVHDASEAVTNDLSQPAKRALRILTYEIIREYFGGAALPADEQASLDVQDVESPYDRLEDRIARVMAERFGAAYPWPAIVKHFDLVMLATEKQSLLGTPPEPWSLPAEIKPLDERIQAWGPELARRNWLNRLEYLGGTMLYVEEK